jgi:hypothetical protein
MIKFENTRVMNFDGALRGMRNPLNSWDKSDSVTCDNMDCEECRYRDSSCCDDTPYNGIVEIGENDLKLAKKLIKAGSDHRKFMRQILVSVDITAPFYWWKEFDTYKVATVANSCSTMHTIHKKELTIEDFSTDKMSLLARDILDELIGDLNNFRRDFLENKDKGSWWDIIQLLPMSYNQKRTVTLNYETLYNIYGSRKNHKLDEWSQGFINWIESLPYGKELIVDRS